MTSLKMSHIPEDKPLRESGITLLPESLGLGKSWLASGVTVSYEMQKIHGKILGNFQAWGTMGLECSRCLEPFQQKAATKFVIEFEEIPDEHNPRNMPDLEDAGLNVVFFSGDDIEFGDEIRQEMELLVPFAPLCRKDCRGLCPTCGGKLNEIECNCKDLPKNNPFTGLTSLFQQNKEN